MAKFWNNMRVELIDHRDGGTWKFISPLVYETDIIPSSTIVVDPDFVTDFCSVPRIPFFYEILGNICQAAGGIHDWLYSPKSKDNCTREQADKILREIIILVGTSQYKADLIYTAVRLFGAQYYKAG